MTCNINNSNRRVCNSKTNDSKINKSDIIPTKINQMNAIFYSNTKCVYTDLRLGLVTLSSCFGSTGNLVPLHYRGSLV